MTEPDVYDESYAVAANEDLHDRLEDAMRAAGCARYRVARDHPFTSRRVATIRPRR